MTFGRVLAMSRRKLMKISYMSISLWAVDVSKSSPCRSVSEIQKAC
jgi:hypothetical protein